MKRLKLNIQACASDEEDKSAYAVDEDFNKVEVYSKEDIDSKILSGTVAPDNSLGKDGDIYLQYE